MADKKKAYIAAIANALIIGLSFMFVKVTLTVASPLDTLGHRFTMAWIGATAVLMISKIRLNIQWKDMWRILPLALLYPIAFFALQVFGLLSTSSSEAGMIQATVPIFTLLFASLLLKERTTVGQILFMCLSVLGVIYLLMMNGQGAGEMNLIGSGLILLSSLAFALYNVFARKLTRQYSLFTLTYVMTLMGFVTFNLMAVGQHVAEGTIAEFFEPLKHMNFVFSIIYLGILSSLLTSYLSNYALSKIQASKMSVFANFATLVTILAGILFLKEQFHLYHLIGAAAILAGVIGTNYLGGGKRQRGNVGQEKTSIS